MSDKEDFRTRKITRDKKEYYIMMTGSTHQDTKIYADLLY